MFLRNDVNESGTPVTWFKCDYCGSEYSVCPAINDSQHDMYNGCTISPCESYDPKRDVDILFMDNKELAKHTSETGIVDIQMLQRRKKYQGGDEDVLFKNKK